MKKAKKSSEGDTKIEKVKTISSNQEDLVNNSSGRSTVLNIDSNKMNI